MQIYGYDGETGIIYIARKGVATAQARNYSSQVEHLIFLYEFDLPAGSVGEVATACANRSFVKSRIIAAFRKNRKVPGVEGEI